MVWGVLAGMSAQWLLSIYSCAPHVQPECLYSASVQQQYGAAAAFLATSLRLVGA